MKKNATIAFKTKAGENRFLFKVLNFGKKTDELKFQFIKANPSVAITYSDDKHHHLDSDICTNYSEISYHSDGALLQKFVKPYGLKDIYRNPHGIRQNRTPLKDIQNWEAVVQLTVQNYSHCPIAEKFDCLVENDVIFNNEPFICILHLGHKHFPLPENNGDDEFVFRVNDITDSLDLAVWCYKTRPVLARKEIGNSGIFTEEYGNMIECVETKKK